MDTSFLNNINWLAVFVAALAYFFLGAIWYSKLLFANRWIALLKIDVNAPDAKKGVAPIMIGSLICMFLISTGLAILVDRMDLVGWQSGLKLGALTGVGFSAMSISINYLYEKKPVSLFLINAGYAIFGQIIAAIILCSWQ
ncbi:MAG TPA: DUF1761 domain-containing protein [Ferruginibacter sp.]|nr:DUF1761 domain-containing protein [Ferruginibacter sp.]